MRFASLMQLTGADRQRFNSLRRRCPQLPFLDRAQTGEDLQTVTLEEALWMRLMLMLGAGESSAGISLENAQRLIEKGLSNTQNGFANKGTISTAGNRNSSKAVQQGQWNYLYQQQVGNRNSALTDQYGRNNYAVTGQEGRNHTATTIQTGRNNTSGIAQIGSNHKATTDQLGSNNTAATIQVGNGQKANTVQTGHGNTSVVIQGGY